ncbi:MAG: hypothetical protein QXO23_06255 [Candidatus Methanomethyliaceae archaeon]
MKRGLPHCGHTAPAFSAASASAVVSTPNSTSLGGAAAYASGGWRHETDGSSDSDPILIPHMSIPPLFLKEKEWAVKTKAFLTVFDAPTIKIVGLLTL